MYNTEKKQTVKQMEIMKGRKKKKKGRNEERRKKERKKE